MTYFVGGNKMTREKAREVSDLYFKIERYENLIDEIKELPGVFELCDVFDDTTIETDLVAVIQKRLNTFNKELEEM